MNTSTPFLNRASILVPALLLIPVLTFAQPANDLCGNAIPITCNSVISGTTTGATTTAAPGPCITLLNTAGGVWYVVEGWNGDMVAALCGSSYDTKIGVYSGSCGALSCIKGNDNDTGPGGAHVCGGGVVSSTTWTAEAGTDYYIYITGAGTATGDFQLTITCGDQNHPCPENGLMMELQTDANGDQTSFEILPEGIDIPVCSGSGFPSNAVITSGCCVPDGCYRLVVMDSAGDGMTTGGYILRTAGTDQRIIDNRNNFSTGMVSSIANDASFCLPIGTDRTIFTSCDKLNWVDNDFIMASMNPVVSAEWIDGAPNNQQDADSGYEFWFFDPNGSYSYVHFRSHSTSHGYGTGPARAAHLRINNWGAVNHIPEGVLMNVRIRGVVNGEPLEWGPACRFKIDPIAAACPSTKLMDIPYHANLSCGQYREFGPGNYVHARPVSGASQYQFRFRQPAEGFEKIRSSSSYFVQLWWGVDPLIEGSQYEVEVRAMVGGNWCPWGDICILNIGEDPGAQGGNTQNSFTADPMSTTLIEMWPNPLSSGPLNIAVHDLPEAIEKIEVDVYDMLGARIAQASIPVALGSAMGAIMIEGAPSAGIYLVHVRAGEEHHIRKLVLEH